MLLLLLTTVPSFATVSRGREGWGNLSNMNMTMGNVELDIHRPLVRGARGIDGGSTCFFVHLWAAGRVELPCSAGRTSTLQGTRRGWMFRRGLSLEGYVSRHVFHLPLYLKTKFRLSENQQALRDGRWGGFLLSYCPHQHIKQTYEGEYLKTKWSLYEPKIRILDEESSNVYMIQRWNVGLAAEAGVEVNDRMTVGVGFKHVLNNMSAIRYMGTIIQPETRMWIASLSVGYFF